jgi:predicted small lipoprotein YifL
MKWGFDSEGGVRMRRLGIIVPLLLVMTLTGCGLAGKAAEKAADTVAEKAVEKATGVSVDQKNNSVTIKGQDGEQLTIKSNEDGKLPTGFPLPLYKGGKVLSSSTMTTNDKKGYTVEMEFDADPKTVADFYEKAMKDRGIELTRMDSEQDGEVNIALTGASDKESVFGTISRLKDAQKTTFTVMWGDK